jgi:hypothetical protein
MPEPQTGRVDGKFLRTQHQWTSSCDLPAVENERITKLRRASRKIAGGQGRDDRLAVRLGDVGDLDRDVVRPGRLLYPASNVAPPRTGFAFQGPTLA